MSRNEQLTRYRDNDDAVCQLEMRYTQARLELEKVESRQRELQATIRRFVELYRNSPVAFLTLDHSARVLDINPAACRLLRTQAYAVTGASFTGFVTDKNLVKFMDHLRRARRSVGQTDSAEIEVNCADEQKVRVQIVTSKAPLETGFVFEMALIDLTAQKALAAVELKAREYAESIVATIPNPMLVVDAQGRVLRANAAFYRVFETSEQHVINWHISDLCDVEWQSKGLETALMNALKKGGAVDELIIRADLWRGSALTLNMKARPLDLKSDGPPCMLVAFEDITRRRRVEEEREGILNALEESRTRLEQRVSERTGELARSYGQLRDLGEQLVLAHESEQRRIARELHDQIGQDLTALKLVLGRGKNASGEDAKKILTEAHGLTDELLQNVRNICGTLRPQVLDDLGLIAGLQWHLKTFSARTGLEISFDVGTFDEEFLSPIVKSTIFRVIQEALTNVSRHGETGTASVMLAMRNGHVEFSIRDDGRGFDSVEAMKRESIGISGMRERLSLVQGRFEITSAPGKGTLIKAQIPIQDIGTTKRDLHHG